MLGTHARPSKVASFPEKNPRVTTGPWNNPDGNGEPTGRRNDFMKRSVTFSSLAPCFSGVLRAEGANVNRFNGFRAAISAALDMAGMRPWRAMASNNNCLGAAFLELRRKAMLRNLHKFGLRLALAGLTAVGALTLAAGGSLSNPAGGGQDDLRDDASAFPWLAGSGRGWLWSPVPRPARRGPGGLVASGHAAPNQVHHRCSGHGSGGHGHSFSAMNCFDRKTPDK